MFGRKKKDVLIKDAQTWDFYQRLKKRHCCLPDHIRHDLAQMQMAVEAERLRLILARSKGELVPLDPIDQEGYQVYRTAHLEPPHLFKPFKINFYELE